MCEKDKDQSAEDHHLLIGHLGDFKSSNLNVTVDSKVTFYSYALDAQKMHSEINVGDFINSYNSTELGDILNRELSKRKEEALPQEIKIIRAKDIRNIWGIFFRE